MREDYAAAYTELSARHWWWRARRSFVLARLEALAPDAGWQRILDVGCGDGAWFEALERFGAVEGVEPDSSLAGKGRARGRSIHVQPFDRDFEAEHRFGLILFLDVLEHLDEPEEALRDAAELLEPGGKVVITVPAFDLLWTNHDEINHHRRRYVRRQLEGQVEEAGLQTVRAQYLFHWVFLAKLIVRLTESLVGPSSGIPGVPPRPLNEFLYGLSRFEQVSRLGRILPLGGSLFLVAELSTEAADR